MVAPVVVEARLAITALFCAAAVVTTGAAAGVEPPPPPPPPFPPPPPLPPHPISKAFNKKIAVSVAVLGYITKLQSSESQKLILI
jgi:hypothetical protein